LLCFQAQAVTLRSKSSSCLLECKLRMELRTGFRQMLDFSTRIAVNAIVEAFWHSEPTQYLAHSRNWLCFVFCMPSRTPGIGFALYFPASRTKELALLCISCRAEPQGIGFALYFPASAPQELALLCIFLWSLSANLPRRIASRQAGQFSAGRLLQTGRERWPGR
jgi:hypothetical protein